MMEKRTPRSSGRILLRLWKYIGKNRILLISAFALSVCAGVLGLAGPKLSGMAINAISAGPGNTPMALVRNYALWMMLCYLSGSAANYLTQVIVIHLSRSVSRKMRRDLFDKLCSVPVNYFDHHQSGDIISILTYDVDTVIQSMSADLLQILQSTVTVVVSFAMMMTIAPKLIVIFLFTIPVTFFASSSIARCVRPLFRSRSAGLGQLNGYIDEMLTGQKVIRAYTKEQEVINTFHPKNKTAAEAFTKAESLGTITGPVVSFLNNASLALISVFGSILFLRGDIRLGDLSSFVQYSRKFSGPVSEAANILSDLQSAFAAAERIFTLLDVPSEPADPEDAWELRSVRGEVRAEHITFSYCLGQPVVRDVSFSAPPGSLTAIVGHTGSGKTTLINLLMRFYNPDSGEIRIDGHDICQLKRASVRNAFAMILQDSWLFHGSIYENIAYGKADVTREQVIRAAKALHIHNYIQRLPEGYDTVLRDDGTSISKGQKQIITIARAMLLDAPMLIMDEATSNVDTQTEELIQTAMRELMKDKTCFVIAHRLSTIQSADQILVMDNGEIIEQGTHSELMKKKSYYYDLYNSQFDCC